MAGDLQPLDEKFAIVDSNGRPTLYFIKWAQQRQIDIGEGITLVQLQEYLDAHVLQAGNGIEITPDGSLNNSPTIAAKVQEILDQITNVQGSILYRDSAAWAALAPGSAGQFLKTNGAGANPAWASVGGGGSFAGALVKKSVDQTAANYTTATPVAWDAEVYDTDNLHSKNSAVTITIASPGVVTWNAHGLINGCPIVFTTTGALPTGLTAGTTYFIVSAAADTFQVSATVGGAAINTSGSQSGVHTATVRNTAFVVPSGVTYASFRAQINLTLLAVGTWVALYIRKNGSTAYSGSTSIIIELAAGFAANNVSSPVLPVSPGDFFEAYLLTETDTSITVEAQFSWFSMEIEA